ncbi:IS5 family transposase [Desulfobulbus oralis]|uniref:IS5 family transposase n=1 Tax=Desulfobulbus oralis TaxID=1986146 RepID=UPI000CF487E3|nr:IS5 family transposase [Desulfobulbus oralis]
MSQLFYLSAEQLERIKPFFPRSHGIPRVDDRKVISGIIYVIKHGLQWKDAPREYGPYKTLYNRFLRWSRMGVFNNIFTELAKTAGQDGQVMIDATHLKAHRTAASLLSKKGSFPLHRRRTKGGLNSKLHALCDGHGRPLAMTLTEGQVSDYKGAALLMDAIDALPEARALLADRGYDADWFRDALRARGITPCIPPRRSRKRPCPYDKDLYKQRHKIEIMFGRIKDWRRIAMRYDRCAHTFFSALCLAASVIFYLD